jgi:hypothetical protein
MAEYDNGKYLGQLPAQEALNLINVYQQTYGNSIGIVTVPEKSPQEKAREIQVHAGKHIPIWLKKKDGHYTVFSDFVPDGNKGNLDCASLCETRETCGGLEKLAKQKIKKAGK